MSNSTSRTALISGISGQDGAYLAKHLLKHGYRVVGTSRDAQMSSFQNLKRLRIYDHVELTSMALNDFRSVLQAVRRYKPNEIYNLAGQSSVGLSFDQPVETMESIAMGTLNLLEVVRFMGAESIKLYNASSSECFGDTNGIPANEETPFKPRSPYAVAKSTAFWEVANYREAYNLYACSGILFNHESPLRPERFVTQKIIRTACRIAKGTEKRLSLGNLDIKRDWGWAPEYVEAMWKMMQLDHPEDFVIATGETTSLENFVEEAFKVVDLDWKDYVDSDSSLMRPSDLSVSSADPSKAKQKLNWKAETCLQKLVSNMMIEGMEYVS